MTPTTDGAQVLARLDECETAWARALAGVVDDLDRPSAAEGWSMRDVADHVAAGGHRFRMVVTGQPAGSGSDRDYVGDDPVATFWEHEHAFRSAFTREDLGRVVAHPFGPKRVDWLLVVRADDIALHAWDIASAAGQPWPVDEDLAGWLLEAAGPLIEELRQHGLFDAPVPAAGDSNRERLLALAGRRSVPSSS